MAGQLPVFKKKKKSLMKHSDAHLFMCYLWLLLCYNSRLNSYNKHHIDLKAKNIYYLAVYRKVKYRGLLSVQDPGKFFTDSLNPLENDVWQCRLFLVCLSVKCIFRNKFGRLFNEIPVVYEIFYIGNLVCVHH